MSNSDYQSKPEFTVKVQLPPGCVLIPSWLAVCIIATMIFGIIGFFLTWSVNAQLVKEIRVLELSQDEIHNVLIRQGIATQSDFLSTTKRGE